MTKRPYSEADLSPESIAQQARDWAVELEERTGLKLPDARETVARRLGIAPGTLERLRKRRLKNPGAYLYWKLKAAIINELQAEAIRLAHEAHILAATGVDPRSDEAAAVVASLSAVHRALDPND